MRRLGSRQAFAELIWRESLCDSQVTLSANTDKLGAKGLRHEMHRSSLRHCSFSLPGRSAATKFLA